MSVDPSHYLTAANRGKPPLLKLQNISARPELNGRFGQAVSYSSDRYVVALLDAETATAAHDARLQPIFLKLRPENLAEAGTVDQLKFGATMMLGSARAYATGPSMRERGRRIVAALPPPLRSRITPDAALVGAAAAALAALVLVSLLLGRVFGSTRVFSFASLVALVLAVSSPDWTEGWRANKPLGLIARSSATNFTRRWRENLASMTGYANISDRVALAALVAVLAFSGKALLTPSPSSSRPSTVPGMPAMPHMPGVPMGDVGAGGMLGPSGSGSELYRLGYDDAISGREFGTSLPPQDLGRYDAAPEGSSPAGGRYDDANFDWTPPPPPKSKSSFGLGTVLSMLTLYRFGKDAVTSPDGSLVLDPAYVVATLRTMEPWRLGIMGMSLYRVVTALSPFFR